MMHIHSWRRASIGAAFVLVALAATWVDGATVPVNNLTDWTSLSYRKITPNVVSIEDRALHIAVDSSASPLVYRLPRPTTVTSVTVRARWRGALKIPEQAVQGERGADDFVLKVGLVESGERTLNWLQRRIAADWVVRLHDLAPAGSGVSGIHFLSTTVQRRLVGTRREHPLSDLLHEIRVHYLEGPGEFEFSYTFDRPIETLALWISSDGDDTGSAFEVSIEQIELDGP